MAWHTDTAETTAHALQVDATLGLRQDEADERLINHGRNVIAATRAPGPVRLFARQFTDVLVLILLAAAVIAGVIGDLTDTLVILFIVLLDAVVGFVQEYRAERAVAALKQLAASEALVLRAGEAATVAATELVPGDVVLLEAGNLVPADMRWIETHGLKTEEAALTGESHGSDKQAAPLADPDTPLAERRNMAYKGTLVTQGRGRGIVVATGMATELGRIAALLQTKHDNRTPLQKRLTAFGRNLAYGVLGLCALLFTTGVLRGEPMMTMLLTAVSLAVAAIPESLPAVITAALALGAHALARQHALVRRLPAVETLGSVTYICSDKTGTLTLNRMRVEQWVVNDRVETPGAATPATTATDMLLRALALNTDVEVDAHGAPVGEPTEVALYVAADQAGYRKSELQVTHPRVAELPFDAARKRMTTLHKETPSTPPELTNARAARIGSPPSPSGTTAWMQEVEQSREHLPRRDGDEGAGAEEPVIAFTKGAPESVLPLCRQWLNGDAIVAAALDTWQRQAQELAAAGLRVLAVAFRTWPALPATLDAQVVERDLVFVGLVGLMDPPRPEARAAVMQCRAAGITPVMITGDHPATARAIARSLGFIEDGGEVLTGPELERLSLEEFEERVEHIRVYARVIPEQKIKIVKALQDRGEFVAMTGDGVNDAPALKRADIGVAMGTIGTDVAKEASDMILLDDNFATIIVAVRAGRRIYDNIRKFVRYTLTTNSGEIWVLLLAPFLGLPIPLLPIHILWINFVTDGFPALALAAEPEEQDIMQRPPRRPDESLFAHGMWQHVLWVGLLTGGATLLVQAWALGAGNTHWQTMVFTVLTFAQLAHVLAIRSEHESLFSQGLRSNLPLLAAVLAALGLQLATIYHPVLNALFKTQPLTAAELAICIALAGIVFVAVEIEKWFRRRNRRRTQLLR